MSDFKVNEIKIEDLPQKHYKTTVSLSLEDYNYCRVDVVAQSFNPSVREIEKGWKQGDGLDHVESDLGLEVAEVIKDALEKHFGVKP